MSLAADRAAATDVTPTASIAPLPPKLTWRPPPAPLALPTLGFILGIMAADRWTSNVGLAALVFAGAAALLAWRWTRRRWLVLAGVLLAFAAVGGARHRQATTLEATHAARSVPDEPILTRVTGTVVTPPVARAGVVRNPFLPRGPQPRTRFLLSLDAALTGEKPEALTGVARVNVDGGLAGVRSGDRVELTGWMYRPRGPQNPGEVDWRQWSARQGVYVGLSVAGPQHARVLTSGADPWRRFWDLVRSRARATLFESSADDLDVAPDARLLDALVLAQRSSASGDLSDLFVQAGAAHLLAVSGFHVGLIAWAAWLILRRMMRRERAAWGVIIVLVVYACVAEANAPVLRATVMGVIACLAVILKRPFAPLNWLAAAALVLLLWNPQELFRAGFQLSFVLVLVLATLWPWVGRGWTLWRRGDFHDPETPIDAESYRALAWRWAASWGGALVGVSALMWIVALPLAALHFGRIAPFGALCSIVLTPMFIVVLGLGLLGSLLGMLPFGEALAAPVMRPLAQALIETARFLGDVTGGTVEVAQPPAWLVAATYVLLLAPMLRTRPAPLWANALGVGRSSTLNRRALVGCLATIVVLWAGWLLWPKPTRGDVMEAWVLSVGDGACALVMTPGGATTAIDVGTLENVDAGETARRALRELDAPGLGQICVSHANFDHYSGVGTLLASTGAPCVATSPYFDEATEKDAFGGATVERRRLTAGDGGETGGVAWEVLWPPAGPDAEAWSANDRSLVIALSYGGRRVLLPGDIERDAMFELRRLHDAGEISLRADVLVAPHHGSVLPQVSQAFYEAVGPQVVVVSTSRPRTTLAQMIHDVFGDACRLFETCDAGAVRIRVDVDGTLAVETPLAEGR